MRLRAFMGNNYDIDLILPADSHNLEADFSRTVERMGRQGFEIEGEPIDRGSRLDEQMDSPGDLPNVFANDQRLSVTASLTLPPLSGHRLELFRSTFEMEAESLGGLDTHLFLSVSPLRNLWWGPRMGGPAEFRLWNIGTQMRVGRALWDGTLFRLFAEVLDPLIQSVEVSFFQIADEGAVAPLDIYRRGFPPPHLEFRELGFAGVVPGYLRDKVLNNILRRFGEGAYDESRNRIGLSHEKALGFSRLVELANGGARYFDIEGSSIGGYALAHG